MLKLSERMVMSFCEGVSASTAHTWTTLSGTDADDVRVMTRKSVDDTGRPPGIVLSAATSFWLLVPPKRIFDFFRDENSRSEVFIIYKHITHQLFIAITSFKISKSKHLMFQYNVSHIWGMETLFWSYI